MKNPAIGVIQTVSEPFLYELVAYLFDSNRLLPFS